MAEGRETDGQIKDFILSLYPDISLRPETRGLGLVVWALPVVAAVAVVGGLAAVVVRRRRRRGPDRCPTTTAGWSSRRCGVASDAPSSGPPWRSSATSC